MDYTCLVFFYANSKICIVPLSLKFRRLLHANFFELLMDKRVTVMHALLIFKKMNDIV